MSLHVVFGAGQVGSGLARTLVARGHTVRVVRRSAAVVPGVEVVAGDAREPAFVARVTAGAAAVYHCMNPSAYTGAAWEAEFPALGAALIDGAIASGARLVCLDNLYAYGIVEGRRTEETALGATGRKGRVRIAWDATLRTAARERGLRYAAGRAGDFFGPGVGDQSLFSPAMVAGLGAGKAAWLVGDPRAPHAFGYVPDVIAGLAALGESDAEGVFHLPTVEVAPATLVARIAEAMGQVGSSYAIPTWAFTVLAPFVPLLRELRETAYQWDRPFLVDDGKFRARFAGIGTSLEVAARQTAAACSPALSSTAESAAPAETR
ncbi:MAG: NAD-dependent epimerase/dehydratase family protein [Pseudomonadota bacterium]|nr:NAD-dependent epimerase/dehydratase family protein [Pseudomonadota bacterium]